MKKVLLVIGSFLFGLAGSLHANSILDNGDFQTGNLTGWDKVSNVSVITRNSGNSFAKFNYPGPAGTAKLYQNFDVTPGWAGINIQYDFLFKTGINGSKPDADFFKSLVRLNITDSSKHVEQLLKIREKTDGWQHVSHNILFAGLTIDPTLPNARLSFVLKENKGDWSLAKLDNVEVNAIPIPAAVWLFGSALLGLLGMRKKSSKVSALPV